MVVSGEHAEWVRKSKEEVFRDNQVASGFGLREVDCERSVNCNIFTNNMP
jgi:hypothetical protein